jgi:hypothetical protein
MMFKMRQGLTLQQSSKHPGLVSMCLHEHQVLNLSEGHHPLDPLLWASILEDGKLLGVLGGWAIWIHEVLQLDPLRNICIRPINLVHLLHLGNERNMGGGSCAQKEAKQQRIWKPYSWPFSGLKFFNRNVITVLCVERTIANL